MPRHQRGKTAASSPNGSQRQLRVGELVRHAIADILAQGNVHDPVLEGHLITVPEVRMSADLKLATIYIMPLGGRAVGEVVAALDRNRKFLRGEIAHRVNLNSRPTSASAPTSASTRSTASRSCCGRRPCNETWKRRMTDDTESLTRPADEGGDKPRQKKRDKRDVHGWVILDKPVGMTSTHAVAVVKRLFSAKRAGHAGTLDPLASGGLPIALGEATKTVPFVMDGRKRYRFTVRWGEERDTDDLEGRTISTSDDRPPAEAIRAAAAGLYRPDRTGSAAVIRPSRSRANGPTTWRAKARPSRWSARPVEIHELVLLEQEG